MGEVLKGSGGLSPNPEKRENQMKGLRKGWKDAENRRVIKAKASVDDQLTEDEKKRIASRRRQLRKLFKPEQLPLLEQYLKVEVLTDRTMATCFSDQSTSWDYKRLDEMLRLLAHLGETLRITPKEQAKAKDLQQKDPVQELLLKLKEAGGKVDKWREEESEVGRRGGE